MSENNRPVWEWVVLVLVITFSMILIGSTYNGQQKIDKQKNLHNQLQIMRTSILLYKAVNKTNPASIEQLVNGTFTLPEDKEGRRFIEHPPRMTQGKLLDPFGNPYFYDPATAWIKSTTRGYEFW